MIVIRDDGLFRHIRFEQPNTCNLWFNVTTWPGFLCISGDAGCYVFSRIPDMFEFFRRGDGMPNGDELSINPDYWGQKLEAIDRSGGLKEYCADTFREKVTRYLDDVEATPELRKAVKREVISRADDGEHEAMRAAIEFEYRDFRFQDFWEYDMTEYSYRFLWCCYAVAWAVRKWDEAKSMEVVHAD